MATKIHQPAPAHQRKLLVLVIAGYVACFHWIYVQYLNPAFDYLGYAYYPSSIGYSSLAFVLSVLPCFWLPLKITRPSQFAYWVIYITVFIPSMIVPLYAGYESANETAMLMVTFFVAFLLTGSCYLVPLWRLNPPNILRRTFWGVLISIAVSLTAWMLVVFRHHLKIVSFSDIYDLRDAATDLSEGSLVNYAFMLLTGAINPFLMGYGLFYRKRWSFLAGAAGQLLVFSVGGTKGSLLSIAFIPAVYVLLRMKRSCFGVRLASACLGLILVSCLLYYYTNNNPGVLASVVLFVICARTLSMGGLLTAQYYHFFLRNPFTYWSHLKFVSWFVHYPYVYPVGQEIGIAFAGTSGLDATTHFYATDGIEAAGLAGLLLIGVVAAFVFWMLDSMARRHDPRMAMLVTAYAAFNLANISIFTTILSGGLALLMIILFLMPLGSRERTRRPRLRVGGSVEESHSWFSANLRNQERSPAEN